MDRSHFNLIEIEEYQTHSGSSAGVQTSSVTGLGTAWHSCTGLLLHCCSVLVSVWVMVLVWQTGSETVWHCWEVMVS